MAVSGSVSDVVLQPDGRIVMAGTDGADFLVARYLADGTLDTAFAGDGALELDVGGEGDIDIADDVVLQSDGKIIVGGMTQPPGEWDFALVRLNTDGSVDSSFGIDGVATVDLGSQDWILGLAVLEDDRILAVGVRDHGVGDGLALLRYTADGALDPTFGGGDGIVTTDLAPGEGQDLGTSVAIQGNGKIVVSGASAAVWGESQTYDFAIVRYESDGAVDTSFGGGAGIVLTDIAGAEDYAVDLEIQSDGYLVSGFATTDSGRDFALVRYNRNGTLDEDFGDGGIVTTDIGGFDDLGMNLAVQPDGKIVVAGEARDAGNVAAVAIVRYNSDGSLDAGFGEAGVLVASIGPESDHADDVVVRPDGTIVVVGRSQAHPANTPILIFIGTDGADSIVASGGDETILGLGGSDTLSGGEGEDVLDGGNGDDLYAVNSDGDSVLEEADAGVDRVRASIDYALGEDLEQLRLAGTTDLEGAGNELDNRLWGNRGDNLLEGLQGSDTIDGGAGTDTMLGSFGSDLYYVDDEGDVVEEVANDLLPGRPGGEGAGLSDFIDTVRSTVSYVLGNHVEDLVLGSGAGAISGTGNGLANVLTGNEAGNTLTGLGSGDTLIGAGGRDTLDGGAGNDVFILDRIDDVVSEGSAQGTADQVRIGLSYTLGANVEKLLLTGPGSLAGTGNDLANTLTGNAAGNALTGLTGNDHLYGKGGADTLTGNAGRDFFYFDTALGAGNVDVIRNFVSGTDKIRLDDDIFNALGTIIGVTDLGASAFVIGSAATESAHRIVYNPASGALSYDADGVNGSAQVQFATLGPTAPATLAAADFQVIS